MAPILTEEESALDPYTILSLPSTSTEKEIRKAYRQASLKYHPDRSSHPDAPAKFREISLALEILVDVAKRQYVDGKLEGERRRKEKYAELDKKRKVMIDALNEREEEAKRAKVEAVQRRKQAAEEEEIKEAGKRMLAEAQKRALAASAQSSRTEAGSSRTNGSATAATAEAQPPISPEDLTIILQFPSTSTLPSTPPNLQPLLEGRYGPITHLIISEPPDTNGDAGKKKKKKGQKAVVEFKKGNWGGCWACWKDHMDGAADGTRRLEEGVKARWAKGETPEWVAWADRQRQVPTNGSGESDQSGDNGNAHKPSIPSFNSAPSFSTTSMADLLADHVGRKEQKRKEEEFESMTLFRMRQAERDRLAEEIRRQEDEE